MPAILDYQCVLALREERNFARAAVALGMSQPALTARLRRLEAELDVRLFDRGRHGAAITAAGSAFAETAERIVAMADEAALAARGAARGMGQSLRIGFTQIAARPTLLPLLAKLREAHPLTRIRLREATSVRLEALVSQDQLDAVLLHPPVHTDGLSELVVHESPLVRVDLGPDPEEGSPLIDYPRSEAPVLIAEYKRRYPDVDPGRPSAEADSAHGALLLSEAGYGPCVVAEDNLQTFGAARAATSSRLDMTLHTSLVWRSLDRRPALRSLIDLCRDMSR
ncbi:MAG: LysR family transcriptional regulator [Pseudomonadota bacterium]